MKNHMIFKFLAILVCACALLGSIITVTGAVSFVSIGLYSHSLEELQNQQVLDNLEKLANEAAVHYAAEGKTSEKLLEAWCEKEYNAERPDDELWYYVLRDENGQILKNKEGTQNTSGALKYEFHVDVSYPIVQAVQEQPGVFPELPQEPLFPEPTDPALPTEQFSYYDDVALKEQYYMLELHDAPLYLVQMYVMPGAYEQEMAFLWELQAWAFDHKYDLFLPMLLCLLVLAAQKQMKSERMRAELITNVSHDIRTPLTSIINYVDLLKSAGSPEEAQAYLEVLSRQSDRMKKLIDDLIELSKASTGNMPVNIQTVDAVEYMNQAIGEFSDKLEAADLTPVFDAPEEPVMMCCDSRLTWRVLSNLMSNAVKYALPGTRLYVDVTRLEGNVLVSLKNISREQLNVDPEELMERFVRGDTSRNTEGSGLGLNIAKSLMELQKGQLQLLVDGDLFKATLLFPVADPVETE